MIQRGIVFKRETPGVRFQEEVERVEHGHLGHHIHLHAELARGLGKYQPGQVIRLRILLPVDEMLVRGDAQRITQDAGARVRRRPQPHNLRTQAHQPVVLVVRGVMERDVD